VSVLSLNKADAARLLVDAPSVRTASSTLATTGPQESLRVVATSSRRFHVSLCNDQATESVYLSFNDVPFTATTSADAVIDPNECFEIDQDNLYTGSIRAVTENATSTHLFVTELNL